MLSSSSTDNAGDQASIAPIAELGSRVPERHSREDAGASPTRPSFANSLFPSRIFPHAASPACRRNRYPLWWPPTLSICGHEPPFASLHGPMNGKSAHRLADAAPSSHRSTLSLPRNSAVSPRPPARLGRLADRPSLASMLTAATTAHRMTDPAPSTPTGHGRTMASGADSGA